MDLYLSLSNRKPYTDLDIKATDCYHYVKHAIFHQDHANKSLVYSLALRLSRLYSFEEDFECHESSMRSWFLKEDTLRKSLIRKNLEKSGKIKPKEKEEKGVPLIVTYHLSLNFLSKL